MTDHDARITYDIERSARLNRWRKPLATRRDRWGAWANMAFADHGFIRLAYLNRHRISENAWRSAQPWPHQIRELARHGVRSVINLRGGQSYGSLPLERETCEALGLHFEVFVLRSRSVPEVADLRAARALFDRLEYPVLFHCKSGADRAGMMCALYLALHEGKPVREAMGQLSLRFGHFRQGKTGVLDAFFAAYLAEHPEEDVPLETWIESSYDQKAIIDEFKPTMTGSLLTEKLLRRE